MVALQFFGGGLGPGAKESWPLSGVLVSIAFVYSIWQLYRVFRDRPEERVRAVGLLCFLGGVSSSALAIGIGRAYEGPRAGFMERYMTLGAPLLCLFYLQFTLYSSSAVKIHLQRALALLMCFLLLVNMPKGLRYATDYQLLMTSLKNDMQAGLSANDLAIRHGEDLGFAPTEVFAQRLDLLRRARLGPYHCSVDNADGALAIQPLSELPSKPVATQRLLLLANQTFAQQIFVPSDSILYRIDVRISKCRERRSPDHLDWDLYAMNPTQSTDSLAHGIVDIHGVGRDDYVSLIIPAISTRADHRFALVFSCPKECSPDRGIEIPLYRCVTTPEEVAKSEPSTPETTLSMKGFLYLKGPAHLAAKTGKPANQ